MSDKPSTYDRQLEDIISQINKLAKEIKASRWDRERLAKLRREHARLCVKRDKMMGVGQ